MVYRDPTGCLTAFYFSPFEVRNDSNPSGDGLPHLSRIKLGGAATYSLDPAAQSNAQVNIDGLNKGSDMEAQIEAFCHWFRIGRLRSGMCLEPSWR